MTILNYDSMRDNLTHGVRTSLNAYYKKVIFFLKYLNLNY